MAPSVSLWCRWALTSTSAGMLFIYTSYKSVSLDLQHKLCQASREITQSECVCAKKKKPSTRNLGAIKHFWGLNYSTRLYSNQIYSALIIAHEHKQPAPAALPDLQNPYVRLCYVLVLNRSLRGQSFHLPLLTPVLLHHANQGGHEDKNRKRLLTILYPSPPSLCPNSSPSSLPEPFMSHPDPSVLFLFSCRG